MAKKDSRSLICDCCGKPRHSLKTARVGEDETLGICYFCEKKAKKQANQGIPEDPMTDEEIKALERETEEDEKSNDAFWAKEL